jgi:2-methylcitrate dehydratase PrpD
MDGSHGPWPTTTRFRPVSRSLTQVVAQYAAGSSLAGIPAAVVEQAKRVIVDEMACAQFGRRSPPGALCARYVRSLGGLPEARVLGTPLRVPAAHAALANGTAGHGEEVDGAHVAGGHPGASIVHAAVAAAERQRASGADLINAVVLGYDIGVRAMRACGGIFIAKSRHHLHADFLYSLGSAVAVGRLLGLDASQQAHAMALVTFQANGLGALFTERHHISKSFSNGQYAYAGTAAALMAAVGMEGCDDIFGARDGLLQAWGIDGGGELMTRGLGEEFAIEGANFKFINAGYPIHSVVEAAMTLVRGHGTRAEDIVAVRVGMPSNAMRVVDNRQMHSICAQDMLAAALLRGGLDLRDEPFPEIASEPAFAPMRARIRLEADPDLDRELPDGRGAVVHITTASGATRTCRVDWPRGHSRRGGVTWADLAGKWNEGLPACDIDRVIDVGRGLEAVEDVGLLVEAFDVGGS